MANRYVRKTGSDSNGGTSTSDAWLTIGKAVGAAGLTAGDTVYVGAGVYRESNVSFAWTNNGAVNTKIIGDYTGSFTGDAGDVIMTSHTTDDVTAPAATTTLSTNGRDNVTIENLILIGGNATPSAFIVTQDTVDLTVRRCVFRPDKPSAARTTDNSGNTAGVVLNQVYEDCVFFCGGETSTSAGGMRFSNLTRHTVDYDVNVEFRRCLFIGNGTAVVINTTGAGVAFPGGVDFYECGFFFCNGVQTNANMSTSIPCNVEGCVFDSSGTALNAAASGQIVENYNIIRAGTPRTNVSAGANSVADLSRAMLYEVGQSFLFSRDVKRMWGAPTVSGNGGAIGGFHARSGGYAVDMLARPSPAGAGSTSKAAGSLERHDTAQREASVVDASTYSAKIVGPGDQDRPIPVNAASTTISIRVRYDTNHGTTNKPQAQLLGGEGVGFAGETKTATSGVDTWETLTFTPFTPTMAGIVTIRMISRSAAGNGIAYFDTLSVV